MTLLDFINKVVDLDELNKKTCGCTTIEDVKLHWQENYKIYVSFRNQTYDKAYSLLKHIDPLFKKFDVLPSFSYFDSYESYYLTTEELLSGLWILLLVYRAVNDLDIMKIKQCKVVDTIEVIQTYNVAKRMHIIKIKYFNDRFDTEVETEWEGDKENECGEESV
jgi:hypothetical protein